MGTIAPSSFPITASRHLFKHEAVEVVVQATITSRRRSVHGNRSRRVVVATRGVVVVVQMGPAETHTDVGHSTIQS